MNKETLKILVISDNHGKSEPMKQILEKESYHYSIHLGDSMQGEEYIASKFDFYVAGNNDFFTKDSQIIEIEKFKFLIMHGHLEGVSFFTRFKHFQRIAQDYQVKTILYGHTHITSVVQKEGLTLICPGSPNYPRGNSNSSYAILTINDGQIINTEIKTLD